jgi:hypothetical protein
LPERPRISCLAQTSSIGFLVPPSDRVIDPFVVLAPVVPGEKMEIDIPVQKFIESFAVAETKVTVDGTVVDKDKMGFAKRNWRQLQAMPRNNTPTSSSSPVNS